ncbi:hypothetical protein [Methanobrevibacter sp.]|uniref:hypothetical protein n=1 Tax=Methanobrevibacter sp. TaxID=66852 RepID=UPI0026DEA38D|nr:hypothetical protein [Methanobrevibacter sp.]MDO5859867.1 hypothetical protein [Methanobrevibacter sp.]
MENKNIIIILVAIIVILALVAGVMFFQTINAKEPTKVKITSNNTLYEGENLTLKLTDLNNTPLSKEKVNITIKNSKGKIVANKTVKTNEKGNAKLDLNLKKGNYTVNVTYGGNENYTGNNTTQKLTIKEEEKIVETQSTTSSDTYVERTEGNLEYGYKDGRYGFWTPAGNFIEDKSRALAGEDPIEPFMRDGSFYSQI